MLKRKPVLGPACSKGLLTQVRNGTCCSKNHPNDKRCPRFQIFWYTMRFYAESSWRLSSRISIVAACMSRVLAQGPRTLGAEAPRIKVETGEIPGHKFKTYAPAELSYGHASVTADQARGMSHGGIMVKQSC
jgi:hypothetical protein